MPQGVATRPAAARWAAAITLLAAAIAAAGCGLGPGRDLGSVALTVTRDYGRRTILDRQVGDVTEADTVMRVLERNAKLATSYGGDFVDAIDGLESKTSAGHYFDWLFYVNGVEATVGAAAYGLHGGESIWWDYRDWSAALHVPAVVGSWPQPFVDGYAGKRHPVAVLCLGGGRACGAVRERLIEAGASPGSAGAAGAIRVLVGPWDRVRRDPAAARIGDGVEASGVFAELTPVGGGYELRGLGEDGRPRRAFGRDAGLVAATRDGEAPPTWVVTGTSAAGVSAAAGLLDAADLRNRYAVAVEGGRETPLPLR
jgi:uncharacterized protein DUF4430